MPQFIITPELIASIKRREVKKVKRKRARRKARENTATLAYQIIKSRLN